MTAEPENKAENCARWQEKAVLFYGPRKAGTTLLHNLLDGGSTLLMMPGEMKIKNFVVAGQSPQNVQRGAYIERSKLWPDEIPRLDRQKYDKLINDLEPYSDLHNYMRQDIDCFYKSLQKQPEPACWGFKEVGSPAPGITGFFRDNFPAGKIVLILREPKMVTRSIYRVRRRNGKKPSLYKLFYEAFDVLRVINHQARLSKQPGCLLVFYENLVDNTEQEIRRICSHIGIAYEAIYEKPTLMGESTVVRTSSKNTTEVFREETKWHDGLTPREKTVLRITHALYAALSFITAGHYVRYKDFMNASAS